MKSILPILILGLLMMVLLPQGEGAPMDSVLRSKRSPQDAEEGDVEATTPVWCNPSNPFRFVQQPIYQNNFQISLQVQSEGGCQV